MILPSRRVSGLRGYSLLEMIVVLALVASLLAITLPAMLRPLGKSELREAAKQVQAALLDARTRAVESGVVQEFRYQPGGRRYEILARGGQEDGQPSAAPGQGTAETPLKPADAAVPEPFRNVLPDGIVFADPQKEAPAETPMPVPTASPAMVEESADGERWSAPVRFYANGRSLNSRLKLYGSKSWSIEILLRGMIGTAIVGEPRREETNQETPNHKSWSPENVSDTR